ncbi:MAG: formate--tetrahydrofolate ligase, partial [Rhodospirillales bacterium]|nr:formate--tetrahydrofolate ligase [Rhodospirillales bacterium]
MSDSSVAAVPADIEIARAAKKAPIDEIGEKAGIPTEALYRYGTDKAKIATEFVESLGDRRYGKLILVTAMTPTPAGE